MNRYVALAMHVVRDALRRNIMVLVVIFVVMAVLATTMLPTSLPRDHVKLTVSWNLWLMIFIGTIAAIFMAATNVGRDIEDKTIFTVLTKPVRKTDIIIGRFLGFEIIMVLLLIPMAVVSYGLIKYAGSGVPVGPGEPPALCALTPLRAQDISQTLAPVAKDDDEGAVPKEKEKKYYLLYGTDRRQAIIYEYNNLDVSTFDETVTISIKPNMTSKEPKIPPECALRIRVVNGADPKKFEEKLITKAENGRKAFVRVKRAVFEGSKSAFIEVRKNITDSPGRNEIYNIVTVAINMKKVELIPRARMFIGNYLKSIFMVFLSFTLITLVAICASTFLTGPVAILFSFFIFFCGQAMEVIKATVDVLAPGRLVFSGMMAWQVDTESQGGRLIHFINEIFRYFLNGLTVILPHFSSYNTTNYLVDNIMIPRAEVAWGLTQFGVFGLILFIVAATIFHFREVAK